VAKAAGVVGTATMISRVFGLLRYIVITAFFSAILLIDYFQPWNTYFGFKTRLIYPACAIVAGGGVFFASTYLLKSPEVIRS
jgi:peptidoglycan biosynthesis protein MviN/MurJ (putative lipid II flippase)